MFRLKKILLNLILFFSTQVIFAQGPLIRAKNRLHADNKIALTSPQVYCTPANSVCGSPYYVEIDSISLGTIHNHSGCTAGGYADYTASVAAANVQAGTYLPVVVKFSPFLTTSFKYVIAATDFNHNGVFDPGEIQKLGSSKTMVSTFFRVPYDALTGITRVRIRVCELDNFDLCSTIAYSEAEDYTINISAASSPGPHFTFYVNSLAPGTGNGGSWANAFNNLSPALSLALPYDTIKVAKGTYVPGNTEYSHYNMKDSVIILGGYPDTGNPGDALRNWSSNQTILSGEYGLPANNNDNTENILYGGNGFVLDGFILESMLSFYNLTGTVILYDNILPKFQHCVFRNSYTWYGGSCIVSTNSSAVFSDCIFYNNIDDFDESAILAKANSNLTFINCVFYKNSSGKSMIENDLSTTNIINCDFVTNHSDSGTITAGNNSVFNINNSIFYNNKRGYLNNQDGSIDSTEIVNSNSTINIANTITQIYNYGNTPLLSVNPKFRDTSSITGQDNLFFSADDGLQLVNPCSPAMNRGSNVAVGTVTKDILGNARIFSTTVDLGAYEVQQAPAAYPSTLYVNKLAAGNGTGSSWANAITDLQQAVSYCSDTIKVAAGTYYPSNTDDQKSFWLQNHRVILGGYPNTGNPTDAQRNPVTNPTLLSGAIPGNTEKSDIIIRGRTVDSTSIVDGFTITGMEGINVTSAAVFLTNNCNPVFRNCTISDNVNNQGSALVTKYSAKPKFIDCIFENNNSQIFDGGGAVANYLGSAPFFLRCQFRNNSTYLTNSDTNDGGAVYNDGSNPVFDSCTFYKNIANWQGGAFYNINSDPVIRNCTFIGNRCAYGGFNGGNGNDMYNDHSNPQVTNTKFYDTLETDQGGCMVNVNGSNSSFTNCGFYNSKAGYDGGVCNNSASSPTFDRCVFVNAGAGRFGGVVYNEKHSAPILTNCISVNNYATQGWGSFMYSDKSTPVIKNCTIQNVQGNPVSNSGLIASRDTSVSSVSNCIFWDNYTGLPIGPPIPETWVFEGSSTQMNNCITYSFGTTGVNGNIVGANPLFVDPLNPAGADGNYFTNDDGWRLVSCSPALNAGLNSSIAGFNTDLLNNPRIYNGTVDMGAYEYQGLPAQTTNTFTGAINNVWENPGNWSLGVIPNACTNVIVNALNVIVGSNTMIWSLTVNSGGNVTVGAGYHVTVLH